jgi:hypothetical protein
MITLNKNNEMKALIKNVEVKKREMAPKKTEPIAAEHTTSHAPTTNASNVTNAPIATTTQPSQKIEAQKPKPPKKEP